jgi:hypothetical protein
MVSVRRGLLPVACLLLATTLASLPAAVHATRALSHTAAGFEQQRTDDSGTGRALLQLPTPEDCNRSVPNCIACRFQASAGGASRASCTRCDAGYVVKSSGRGCCECAPGAAGLPACAFARLSCRGWGPFCPARPHQT